MVIWRCNSAFAMNFLKMWKFHLKLQTLVLYANHSRYSFPEQNKSNLVFSSLILKPVLEEHGDTTLIVLIGILLVLGLICWPVG